MGNRISIPIGTRFGRWTVLDESAGRIAPNGHKRRMFHCICDCGRGGIVFLVGLSSGHSTSCGCTKMEMMRRAVTTHGKSKTRIYMVWKCMRRRCNNPRELEYHNYGGRGITVCDEWQNFENFYKDMGDPPLGMSIDRIDNNKGYYPENCRWANAATQSNNKRNTIHITFDGKTKTISDWSKEKGVKTDIIRYRLRKGWPKPMLFKLVLRANIPT